MAIPRGDFSFLESEVDREMLQDAFQAVSEAGAWDLLKNPSVPGSGGFMFGQNPAVKAIESFIKYEGHSGASHGMTMRVMEFIAKNGWGEYVEDVKMWQEVKKKTACYCRSQKGYKMGWCGVAGGGVPGCDH